MKNCSGRFPMIRAQRQRSETILQRALYRNFL